MIAQPYHSEGLGLGRMQLFAFVFTVVVCRMLAIQSFHIYDDAFITYRYSQNMAAGLGLVFNPGASWEPVLGTTTPGYAVLLALPCWLGAPVIHASLAINILCDAASAFLIMHLLRARPLAAILSVLAFAVIPEVGRISVGGMESPLFVLLALGAVTALEARRFAWAGWLAALDCTVRPEAVMLVVLLAALYLRSWAQALRFFLPIVIVGLTATVILTAIYGHPIPQSVRAKAGTHGLGRHLRRASAILAQGFGPSLAMRAAAPLAGLGFLLTFVWRTPARGFVAFGLAIVASYCAAGVKTWGWYFYVPLTAWCVALGIGVDAAIEFLARARPAWRFDALGKTASFVLAGLVLCAVGMFTYMHPDRVTPRVYRAMNDWIASEHIVRDKPAILASDIGAIGFFSGTRILDSEGLVWPQARDLDGQVELIKTHLPDYVMLVVTAYRIDSFVNDPVSALYEPVARFTIEDTHDLAPDPSALPDWWEQDYIFYRRRDYAKRTE